MPSNAFADDSAIGPSMSDAGSCLRSSSVSPCAAAESEGSPIGSEPSGSIRAARWPYRRIQSASLAAPTIFWMLVAP
jgi:hypothetical protein